MSGRDVALVRGKTEPALLDALEAAGPDDQVRAMLVLVPPSAAGSVDPAAFPSRAAYRKAVQTERAESTARQFAPLDRQLDELQAAGLDVHRDPGSAVVVVEGPPQLVVSAVAHRQVESATLDAAMTGDGDDAEPPA